MIYNSIYQTVKTSNKNCFIIQTDENYLISSVKKGIKQFLSDYGDYTTETYDDSESMLDILQQALTGSLFSTRKFIIIEGYSKVLKQAEIKMLKRYIDDPIPDYYLLIVDYGKTFQSIQKDLFSLNIIIKETQIIQEATDYFNKRDISVSANTVYDLVRLSSNNIDYCMNEAKKLADYVMDSKVISEKELSLVVKKNLDGDMYLIVNALSSGNYELAIKELDYFLQAGEKPSTILNSISSVYKRMFYVSLLKNENVNDLASLFNVKTFAIEKTLKNIGKYKPMTLKKIVEKCDSLEYAFKRGDLLEKQALTNVFSYIISLG